MYVDPAEESVKVMNWAPFRTWWVYDKDHMIESTVDKECKSKPRSLQLWSNLSNFSNFNVGASECLPKMNLKLSLMSRINHFYQQQGRLRDLQVELTGLPSSATPALSLLTTLSWVVWGITYVIELTWTVKFDFFTPNVNPQLMPWKWEQHKMSIFFTV